MRRAAADVTPSRGLAMPTPLELAPALRRYTNTLTRWRPGNRITILRAGIETYPAMLVAIAGAKRTIHLETYILEDDKTGHLFGEALAERARAGVRVRLLFDSLGSMSLGSGYLARLRDVGVDLVEYRPIVPWKERWGLVQRDHRKILVVDAEVGFTGGLNIADEYAAKDEGGGGWHDVHCELRGPIVHDLERLFRRGWLGAGGPEFELAPRSTDTASPSGVPMRLLNNTERRRRAGIRRAYLTAINAAQKTVYIENAYFLPDRGIRTALRRAARRGVDVRIIVPGRSDIRTVEYASYWLFPRMLKAGIKVHRWRDTMMHAKTAVIDGAWSTIGSYNLDSRSLFDNLEVAVEVLDQRHGEAMNQLFLRDLDHTDPVDADIWKNLAWWQKLWSWFAFRIRRWL